MNVQWPSGNLVLPINTTHLMSLCVPLSVSQTVVPRGAVCDKCLLHNAHKDTVSQVPLLVQPKCNRYFCQQCIATLPAISCHWQSVYSCSTACVHLLEKLYIDTTHVLVTARVLFLNIWPSHAGPDVLALHCLCVFLPSYNTRKECTVHQAFAHLITLSPTCSFGLCLYCPFFSLFY